MRKIANFITVAACLLSVLVAPMPARAADTTVQPPAATPTAIKPDVVITAFGGSDLLDFAELYNQSSDPANLTGVQLRFTVRDSAPAGCGDQVYSIAVPNGWLLPKAYFTFERGEGNVGDLSEAHYTAPVSLLAGCITPQLSDIQLIDGNGAVLQDVAFTPGTLTAANWAQHKQRAKSSLSVTDVFDTDYNLQTSGSAALYSTPLYQPPTDTAGLQIVELLPHSPNCSPTDTGLLCNDYVKLFNVSGTAINLANYRLRTSYGGLKSSSSNTISLSGSLEPGQYRLVNGKNDGSVLSLTQTGGYAWLEDAYGAQTYQPVITYPDASADNKIGQTWAFDGTDWQWTSSPQPDGPNYFPIVALTELAASTSSLKPCAANQERNPDTNRCRLISAAIKTPAACKPGQERNPATNRCRSIAAATKKVTPCKPGQTRNPATNRCHSAQSATKSRKPCKPGQERNPDTGRCRKAQPKISSIQDIKTAAKVAGQHWYLIATIAAIASAYILYEWHQEFAISLERLKAKLARLKLKGGQNGLNLLK